MKSPSSPADGASCGCRRYGRAPADRYVPTYLYLLLQLYAEEGGDLNVISESLAKKGINLDDLEAYLPNR